MAVTLAKGHSIIKVADSMMRHDYTTEENVKGIHVDEEEVWKSGMY